MEPAFWLERWQRNEIGFHRQEINLHLQSFWSEVAAGAGDRVFVPLCGKTRDMLWLRAQGHPVLGVEISPIAVESFFVEHGLEPERRDQGRFQRWEVDGLVVLQGDFFELTAADLDGVVAVYDRASLVALPPELRRRYAGRLAALLGSGTRVLLVTMEYPQAEMEGPPFSVEEAELYALYAKHFELRTLYSRPVLEEHPRFQERGLSRLQERAYCLTRR
jgi:thiopurine S-methyltransferase